MDSVMDRDISRRFIVLITDGLANNNDLARSIYWMAERENLAVLYLVLVADNNNMLAATRSMVTMKAMTSANRLLVEAKLIDTGHWLETLRTVASPGDVIICQEEHSIVTGPYQAVPANEFLSSRIDIPIRTITGYSHPFQTPAKKRFPEILSWTVFLIIMAVFSGLQIQVNQAFDGSTAKMLVFISFCIEMAAVWVWYRYAYR